MYKKIMILMLVICLALPVIAAQTYQKNVSIDLKIPCTNNGTMCSPTATCNNTIISPNGTLLVNNKQMTQNSSTYNYTLTPSQTNALGEYQLLVTCTEGADSGARSLLFHITNSGIAANDAAAETITRGIYILLAISILFFIGFYFHRDDVWKWSFFLIGLMFIIVTLNLASLSIHNYSLEADVFNVFDKIGAISYYMIWFVGGLLLMIWILKVLASLAERRNMGMAQRVGSPMNLG